MLGNKPLLYKLLHIPIMAQLHDKDVSVEDIELIHRYIKRLKRKYPKSRVSNLTQINSFAEFKDQSSGNNTFVHIDKNTAVAKIFFVINDEQYRHIMYFSSDGRLSYIEDDHDYHYNYYKNLCVNWGTLFFRPIILDDIKKLELYINKTYLSLYENREILA